MMMLLVLRLLITLIIFEYVTSNHTLTETTTATSRLLTLDNNNLTTTSTWIQLGSDMDGVRGNDESGTSVAISADGYTVIIGAPFYDGINGSNSGHVRVFRYHPVSSTSQSSIDWEPWGIQTSLDGESFDDESGSSVAISADGTRIAIGAPKNDGINGVNSGQVRVYQQQTYQLNNKNTTQWVRVDMDNTLDGEEQFDQSAFAVRMNADGTVIAIGARFNDGNQSRCISTGHVRVYQNIPPPLPSQTSSWRQIGSDIDGESMNDESGYRYSIALSSNGTIIAIGAYRNDNLNGGIDAGQVRVYRLRQQPQSLQGLMIQEWVQIGSDIDGIAPNDRFGWSVAISADGTLVVVGAPQGNRNTGQVRVFHLTSTTSSGKPEETWVQLGSSIDGSSPSDQFGHTVAISSDGTIIAIGAPFVSGSDVQSGQVRVYQQQLVSSSIVWLPIGPAINGEAGGDRSGYSLAMSSDGTIIAIGAYFNDGNNGVNTNSGHVRVYQMKMNRPPPTANPTQSPMVVNDGRCGLFGLRIFCLRRNECGLFRRLFRIGSC